MIIRGESVADHDAIRALHLTSFPSDSEADLVEALRADGDAEISLVGDVEGQLIGHVMCSKMQAPFKALGLAPVAVHPVFRRRGFAQMLIQAALAQAKKAGWEGVFVLGDPKYYRRIGFSAELAARFQSPYAGPYLMALSLQTLQNETLPAQTGDIKYAPAFAALS